MKKAKIFQSEKNLEYVFFNWIEIWVSNKTSFWFFSYCSIFSETLKNFLIIEEKKRHFLTNLMSDIYQEWKKMIAIFFRLLKIDFSLKHYVHIIFMWLWILQIIKEKTGFLEYLANHSSYKALNWVNSFQFDAYLIF